MPGIQQMYKKENLPEYLKRNIRNKKGQRLLSFFILNKHYFLLFLFISVLRKPAFPSVSEIAILLFIGLNPIRENLRSRQLS